MPVGQIEPRRLYRQVADQLRSRIESGEFKAGERLPTERELALQLGVSRPTVREALIALEVDGRIRIRVGSGIYVQAQSHGISDQISIPVAGPFDILNARSLIEGAVAEEAAKLAKPEDISRIGRIIEQARAKEHPGHESIRADRAFHVALADILGNDAITKVVGDLFDQRINPYFAQLAKHFENAESWRSALSEHQLVLDCLAAGNPAGARCAMQAHMQQSQIRYSKTFGEAQTGAPERGGVRVATPHRPHTANAGKSQQKKPINRRIQS